MASFRDWRRFKPLFVAFPIERKIDAFCTQLTKWTIAHQQKLSLKASEFVSFIRVELSSHASAADDKPLLLHGVKLQDSKWEALRH